MAPRVAVPTDPNELAEMLNDPNKMKDLFNSPTDFKQWLNGYVDSTLQRDTGILDQVKEQCENFMVNWLRDNETDHIRALNLDPNSRRPVPKNTLYNPDAMGAKYDDYFNSHADFFNSILSGTFKNQDLSRKLETLRNDLSSVKPSDGGFLIPEILRAEMLQVALETSVVRSRARVIPMDSLTVPFPSVDSTSNVSSVFGGVTGYWTEEGATLTESQPRFGRVVLNAHKLTLYTEVPNELPQDAPALNAFMSQMFPEALAWFEDVAFFVGNGVGEPLGFLNAPAQVAVTRAAGGNAIDWLDVVNMYSRMLPQSLARAVWITSPDSLPSLFQMTNGGYPVFLGSGLSTGGTDSPPMSLLGCPIIVSEKARASGTQGDLNFVDFGYYLIGDRQSMSAKQSEEFRFQNDITAYRVIERIDGRPWLQSAITPQNNSANTLSPFIQLL
jgi:HK97 family phage major capsid protein